MVAMSDGDGARVAATLPPERGRPAVAPLVPADPRAVGGYRIEGRLGAGGMGTVYLARAEAGRPVALKVIRAEFASDRGFLARFGGEVAAARRVARFCTAQVLDSGVDGGLVYLVTEYIDGPTLAAEVEATGPMSGSTLDGLAIGVAAALHGIHGAGVIHRDLKPGNVLLSRVGPKVIDFGVARALDGLGAEATSGEVWGTPAYMAPEQFGAGRATSASDVFAWGAVVAYAGTGRAPFGTGTPLELMRRIVDAEADLAGLDDRLGGLVRLAMHKDPQQRPSAYELLRRLVGGADDPIDATTEALRAAWPMSTVEHVRPRRSGRRPLVAAAVVLAVAVTAAVVATAWPDDGTAPRSTPGPVQTSSTVDEAATVGTGTRVPPTGYVRVGLGETRIYRFDVPAGVQLYVEGMTEGCAHLLPWRLVGPGGGAVAQGELGCGTYGPVPLAVAGTYQLRIGGDAVDGTYAFRLTIG
jgi:Protein kinase domain